MGKKERTGELRSSILSLVRSIADIGPIRKLYEETLLNQVSKGPMPSHVAFILDGNRRWAKERDLPIAAGHAQGAKKLGEVLSWLFDLDIKTITVYALSIENLNRPSEEIRALIEIMDTYLAEVLGNARLEKSGVRVKLIGNLGFLPERTRTLVHQLEQRTANNSEYYFNVAIGYGGRQEIVEAMRKLAQLVQQGKIGISQIDEKAVSDLLYTSHLPNPEPDMVIRTSGEFRTSNFLLWQSAYSEFLILDVYWPDFRRIDLLRAIRSYQSRERRFGT